MYINLSIYLLLFLCHIYWNLFIYPADMQLIIKYNEGIRNIYYV